MTMGLVSYVSWSWDVRFFFLSRRKRFIWFRNRSTVPHFTIWDFLQRK